MRSTRVLCHVQRCERPNHGQSTALTSANPQLQIAVFVGTAALELARQHSSTKKAGDHLLSVASIRGQSLCTSSHAAAGHERGKVAGLQELCRAVEFIHQEEEWWICPGTGSQREVGRGWPAAIKLQLPLTEVPVQDNVLFFHSHSGFRYSNLFLLLLFCFQLVFPD